MQADSSGETTGAAHSDRSRRSVADHLAVRERSDQGNLQLPVSSAPGPIVVVGAHVQGLFMYVQAVAGEGESVLGWGYEEPPDGGKATNQAVAAARLGAPVTLVSVVGKDERGRRALGYLRAEGVDTRCVLEVDRPTDVGFVMLPPSRIPAIATAQDCSRELNPVTVKRAAGAIRRGSVLLGQLEAPEEGVVTAFRLAREAGLVTILNPSPAQDLSRELLQLTNVLVPNEHEAAALSGSVGGPGELAVILDRRLPVDAVIVTAGELGAYMATAGNLTEHVIAPRVDVVDTTGAGDAFVAALAVRLREGNELSNATRFAVSAASLSVTRLGTMPAFPKRDEVDAVSGPWVDA
jgi:ribokinase